MPLRDNIGPSSCWNLQATTGLLGRPPAERPQKQVGRPRSMCEIQTSRLFTSKKQLKQQHASPDCTLFIRLASATCLPVHLSLPELACWLDATTSSQRFETFSAAREPGGLELDEELRRTHMYICKCVSQQARLSLSMPMVNKPPTVGPPPPSA